VGRRKEFRMKWLWENFRSGGDTEEKSRRGMVENRVSPWDLKRRLVN